IKKDASFEYTIIKGKCKGTFSSMEVLMDSEDCEFLVPHEKPNTDDTSSSISFTMDNSDCSRLTWWMIILIAIGCLLVIGIGFIISVYKIKPLREQLFPYDKRKNNKEDKVEINPTHKNQLYSHKSKTNPIYE